MINPNWSRWILASIIKHINDKITLAGSPFPLFVEGAHRDEDDLPELAELRVDGPYYRNPDHRSIEAQIEINILLQCVIQDNAGDFYALQRMIGTISEALTRSIPVFKYGPSAVIDDGSLVGCMIHSSVIGGSEVKTNVFGQIDLAVKQQQASVEGHYRMDLEVYP